MGDDGPDDEMLEALAAEIDEDAILVMQFEDSIAETIQADSELSAYYSSHQEARRRPSERVKVRGFWPVHRGSEKVMEKSAKAILWIRIAVEKDSQLVLSLVHAKGALEERVPNPNASSSASTVPASFVIAEDLSEDLHQSDSL